MSNLFSDYEPIVYIVESSVYDLFSRYKSILFISNKIK